MESATLDLPDPRNFPDAASAPPEAAKIHALAQAGLAAETGATNDAADRDLRVRLDHMLRRDGDSLAAVFSSAPSVAVSRYVWRRLDGAWAAAAAETGAGLAVTVFALPIVIVSGVEGAAGDFTHPGILDGPGRLAAILRDHGALGGNRTFALANALAAADAIDIPRLPGILAWQRLPDSMASGAGPAACALAPAPLNIPAGREGVHLRFLVGSAVAKPGLDLLADAKVGKWGMPFTREISRQLGIDGASVLALPRAPQRPLPAVAHGRAVQREIGAQLFATNTIRRLRAAVGEPTAVISGHRANDAPGGGELRLSLSSPFAPRDAEGFRCPLYPLDRVSDVASMLVDLLTDCRVTDIRFEAGVHPDRDPVTGMPLLFKPDGPPGAAGAFH
jgi:hypothetical protein